VKIALHLLDEAFGPQWSGFGRGHLVDDTIAPEHSKSGVDRVRGPPRKRRTGFLKQGENPREVGELAQNPARRAPDFRYVL
jgi:hypothetical protein